MKALAILHRLILFDSLSHMVCFTYMLSFLHADTHPFSAGVTNLIKRMMRVDPQQRPFVNHVIAAIKTLQSEAENRL